MQNSTDKCRVALVTGGTRGIGKAVVLRLAEDNCDIAFCYQHSRREAEKVCRMIEEKGRTVYHAAVNVNDIDAVRTFISDTEQTLGPIDIIVNNAGVLRDKTLVMMEPQDWSHVVRTNLDSVFHVCRCVVFHFMKRKTGCIVNISSLSGVYGNRAQTNYSAAKAGVIGFTLALAKEMGPFGVRVNAVAPGYVGTDMLDELPEKEKKKILERILLGRIGKPEEVADLVAFLVSEKAGYIHGQTIHIDGGVI